MDDRQPNANGQVTDGGAPSGRRVWSAPVLRRHESLTVLTQSMIGPGMPFLLAVGCSATGGCTPSPNRVGPGAGPASGPAYGGGGGGPYTGPYPQ